MKKRNPLFIIFSLICVGGWIAKIFFDLKLGSAFAALGHLGQAYFIYKDSDHMF
ncbi:hypothetical protein N9Z01_02100 [Flavobacteriaceae bacterium]|nr:hypothetical protein [Flavobacteriaceae bacterium]